MANINTRLEIWKDILNYGGFYEVSNLGNVKSFKKQKKGELLKPCLNNHGYLHVLLSKNGKYKTKKIHQLVAETFLNHIPCGHKLVVNHINFNKTDNRVGNLEIITSRENTNLKHIKSSSQYVGVSWIKNIGKWSSRIQVNGKNEFLGHFTDELDAHNAYQNKLKEITTIKTKL